MPASTRDFETTPVGNAVVLEEQMNEVSPKTRRTSKPCPICTNKQVGLVKMALGSR